jgi:hypothetical protein
MRWLLSVWLALVLATPALAQNYGVDAQERVIRLPQDAEKWHVSVIGNDARHREVLDWFDSVPRLKTLKLQVHFHQVAPTDPLYAERYAPNIRALPTVRVQDHEGAVIFEAAGKDIPMTGEGLYSAIADKVNGAEELLPWRRNNKKPLPEPEPEPYPTPDTDPAPLPLDDGGAPVIEPVDELPNLLPLIACIALLIGSIIGQIQASKNYHSSTN